MRKLSFKLFLSYFLITLFLSLFIFIFSYKLIKNAYIKELETHLKDVNLTLMSFVSDFIKEKKEFDELDKFIKELGKKINIRITVIDTSGKVLADSKEDPKIMENHKTRPEVISALKKGKGISIRYSETIKEEMLYLALVIKKDKKITGILRTSIFMKDIDLLLSDLRKRILLIISIILVFSWVISFLISENFSSPLRLLLRNFKRLSQGEFNVKVFTKRKDEIGELIKGFNEMTLRVEKIFKEIKEDSAKLIALFSSIPDGILLMDREEKIVLYNEKMSEILKENIEKGKFYFQVIKIPEFGKLMDKIKRREEVRSEIEIKGRIYLCSLRKITETGEILAFFHDITEMKKLEEIKKELIINISHEIKTPLTAIKGYIETIEEEEEIKNRKYIEIIKNHIERLMDIIEKTIYLSKLETAEDIFRPEEINLNEIINNVLPLFEKRLEEKKINLKMDIEEGLKIKADRFKMEQVFINLFDNSIKYTEDGEIRIKARREENNVIIEFRDTGEGIPEEHLSRIFERFYVVDKSRDRKKGGAGLGLSIVKHIIHLHNGKIEAESERGRGTRFVIHLPI